MSLARDPEALVLSPLTAASEEDGFIVRWAWPVLVGLLALALAAWGGYRLIRDPGADLVAAQAREADDQLARPAPVPFEAARPSEAAMPASAPAVAPVAAGLELPGGASAALVSAPATSEASEASAAPSASTASVPDDAVLAAAAAGAASAPAASSEKASAWSPEALAALATLPLSSTPEGRVYFASGKVDLPALAATEFDRVLAVAAARPQAVVVLSGFHDRFGQPETNAALARDRAQAVRAALIARGLEEARTVLRKPEATLGSGSRREARRVEIRVVDPR